jgi:hypothetical protein
MGVEVTLGEALELGVVLAVADGVGEGAGLADELGVELGVELGEGLWPGDGVAVLASEGSVDELAEGLGVALASGDESSMKVSVRFSGVANARTENVPFWIPGRISIRSMTAGAARVKVISVPAPHDVLGPEAQKVVKSDPTSATAGLHISLLALQIEEGKEVITSPISFLAVCVASAIGFTLSRDLSIVS